MKIFGALAVAIASVSAQEDSPGSERYGSGYGDPHFMVVTPDQDPICFDFNPPSGSTLSLLVDPESNLVVSADVQEREQDHHTYMTRIHFSSPNGAHLEFDMNGVTLAGLPEGSESARHPQTGIVQYGDINFVEHWNKDSTREKIIVEIEDGPSFIVKERIHKGSLSFGIHRPDGLSDNCRGVIGQFMTTNAYKIFPNKNDESRALILANGIGVEAELKDFHHNDMCWTVEENDVLLMLAGMRK